VREVFFFSFQFCGLGKMQHKPGIEHAALASPQQLSLWLRNTCISTIPNSN